MSEREGGRRRRGERKKGGMRVCIIYKLRSVYSGRVYLSIPSICLCAGGSARVRQVGEVCVFCDSGEG